MFYILVLWWRGGENTHHSNNVPCATIKQLKHFTLGSDAVKATSTAIGDNLHCLCDLCERDSLSKNVDIYEWIDYHRTVAWYNNRCTRLSLNAPSVPSCLHTTVQTYGGKLYSIWPRYETAEHAGKSIGVAQVSNAKDYKATRKQMSQLGSIHAAVRKWTFVLGLVFRPTRFRFLRVGLDGAVVRWAQIVCALLRSGAAAVLPLRHTAES